MKIELLMYLFFKMRDRFFKVLLGSLFFYTICSTSHIQAEVVDALVGVVDNLAIPMSEVISTGKVLQEIRGKKITVSEAINYLVQMIVIEQEASKMGIKIEDEAVDATISQVAKRNNLTLSEFKQVLENRGINYGIYGKVVRYEMLRQEYIRSFVQPRVTVSRGDVMEYYRNLKDKNLKPVNVVVVSGDSIPELERLRRLVKKGEIKVERISGASSKGVKVLKIRDVLFGDLNDTLKGIVESMKPGDVSPIMDLEGAKGFVIFKGYSADSIISEDLYRRLEYAVFQKKIEKEFMERIELVKTSHFIDIKRLKNCHVYISNIQECMGDFSKNKDKK